MGQGVLQSLAKGKEDTDDSFLFTRSLVKPGHSICRTHMERPCPWPLNLSNAYGKSVSMAACIPLDAHADRIVVPFQAGGIKAL